MNQPLNIFQPRSTATLEDLLEKSSRAREAVWQQLGSLEPLVLSHLVSPTLSGGPKWPALRQAFRLVRRPNGNVILASDGLSDPFDDITLGGHQQTFHMHAWISVGGALLKAKVCIEGKGFENIRLHPSNVAFSEPNLEVTDLQTLTSYRCLLLSSLCRVQQDEQQTWILWV